MLQALMQDAKSSSTDEAKAPGSVFLSQRITYTLPAVSVKLVPLEAGQIGPEEAVGVAEEESTEVDVLEDDTDVLV